MVTGERGAGEAEGEETPLSFGRSARTSVMGLERHPNVADEIPPGRRNHAGAGEGGRIVQAVGNVVGVEGHTVMLEIP